MKKIKHMPIDLALLIQRHHLTTIANGVQRVMISLSLWNSSQFFGRELPVMNGHDDRCVSRGWPVTSVATRA